MKLQHFVHISHLWRIEFNDEAEVYNVVVAGKPDQDWTRSGLREGARGSWHIYSDHVKSLTRCGDLLPMCRGKAIKLLGR